MDNDTNEPFSVSPPQGFFTHGHVIIIDDDVDILEVLSLVIRHFGYSYEAYVSADHYLSSSHYTKFPNKPTCILSDVKMPGMDGLMLQQQLAGTGSIPLILMSGHCTPREIVKAYRNQLVDFLVKPFSNDEMLHAIATALKSHADQLDSDFIKKKYIEKFEFLSDQEKNIAFDVSKGLTSQNIAEKLGIGLRTVKLYRKNIYRKMSVSSGDDFLKIMELILNKE